MENRNGDPSTLAVCGCCRVSDSGCSHFPTKSPTAEEKVAQAERQEVVLLQQLWVSHCRQWGSAQGLLQAQSVIAEPALFGTHINWSHFIIPSLRNLVWVVEMVTVMGERWRWHLTHLSLQDKTEGSGQGAGLLWEHRSGRNQSPSKANEGLSLASTHTFQSRPPH